MKITKATNTTIFFSEIEYNLLCKWLKEAHHITAPRAARFVVNGVDPIKHSFDFGIGANGHGYQLSENSGSSQHPWRVSFPNTQFSAFGNFNLIPVESSINGAADLIHMKLDRNAVAEAANNPPQIVSRTRKNKEDDKKETQVPFEPKVIVDVPLPDDPSKVMTLSDFIFSVQDLNHYLKSNSAITVQVKNNRIVYLISND